MGQYTFNNSNIGAAGDNATNYGNWIQSGDRMNLENLAKELAVLQAKLASPGDNATTDPVKKAAADAVKEAATAALNSDGKTAFSYLAKAGHWAIEVAKAAALPVALSALKAAIGIGP